MKLDPRRAVAAELYAERGATRQLVEANLDVVRRLGTLSEIHFRNAHLSTAGGIVRSGAGFELAIRFGDAVDTKAEAAKLRKELARLAGDIESKKKRLADPVFRSKAPEKVVRGLETTLAERESEQRKLAERLRQLADSG
jgi:valyl-tRNA synthetase